LISTRESPPHTPCLPAANLFTPGTKSLPAPLPAHSAPRDMFPAPRDMFPAKSFWKTGSQKLGRHNIYHTGILVRSAPKRPKPVLGTAKSKCGNPCIWYRVPREERLSPSASLRDLPEVCVTCLKSHILSTRPTVLVVDAEGNESRKKRHRSQGVKLYPSCAGHVGVSSQHTPDV
jgi:hypothetical protein